MKKRSVYYFGLNLRRKRKALNMTQYKLAQAIGCGRNHISSYEMGNYLPSAQRLIEFADFFNCPIDELFEEV